MSKRVSFEQFSRRGKERKMENQREKEVIKQQREHLGQLQHIQDKLLQDISTNMGRVMVKLDEDDSDGEDSVYQSVTGSLDVINPELVRGKDYEVVRLATQPPGEVDAHTPHSTVRKTLRDEASPQYTASPNRTVHRTASPHRNISPHRSTSSHRTDSSHHTLDPMHTLIRTASQQMETLQNYICPQTPPQRSPHAMYAYNETVASSPFAIGTTTTPHPSVTPPSIRRTSHKTGKHKYPLPKSPPANSQLQSPSKPQEEETPIPTNNVNTLDSSDDALVHDSAFRAALLEKHAKHIEDLRKYYEAEIASLKEKLANSSGVEKGTSGLVLAKLETVEMENKKLKTRCSSLEAQLDDAMKERSEIMNQEEKAKKQTAEWREHCASSDKLVDMLKERLEVTKLELQEQDTLKDEIDGDLQGMRKALKTQERQHQLKTTSLLCELDEVHKKQSENNANHDREMQKCKLEMQACIEKYKMEEEKSKRTIQELEIHVRKLECARNRANSIESHFKFGHNILKEAVGEKRRTSSFPTSSEMQRDTTTRELWDGKQRNSSCQSSTGGQDRKLSYYTAIEEPVPAMDHRKSSPPRPSPGGQVDEKQGSSSHRPSSKKKQMDENQRSFSVREDLDTSYYSFIKQTSYQPAQEFMNRKQRSSSCHPPLADNPNFMGGQIDRKQRSSSFPSAEEQDLMDKQQHSSSYHTVEEEPVDLSHHHYSAGGQVDRKQRNSSYHTPMGEFVDRRRRNSSYHTAVGACTSEPALSPYLTGNYGASGRVTYTPKITLTPCNPEITFTPKTPPLHMKHGKGGYSETYKTDPLVNSVLKDIKDGKIITGDSDHGRLSMIDRVRKPGEIVAKAELKLHKLNAEKELLEHSLQRIPGVGSRESKQTQLDKEAQLDTVMQEIDSTRFVLRKHKALKNPSVSSQQEKKLSQSSSGPPKQEKSPSVSSNCPPNQERKESRKQTIEDIRQ